MDIVPRKASEVLLELESKLNSALSIIRTQDLNIKILSNKLNSVIELLEKQAIAPQRIIVETANTTRPPTPEINLEKQIPISTDFALPLETSPKGFRRTSRPETFSGDDSYLPESSGSVQPKFPTQIPKSKNGKSHNDPPPGRELSPEVVVPPTQAPIEVKKTFKTQQIIQNAIPVSQRVVNKDGKSLFLADVEIIDIETMQSLFKTRTNGSGKWSASLGIGSYRILINKRESSTGPKLEATQDIHIDGSESKVDLQTIIIRS